MSQGDKMHFCPSIKMLWTKNALFLITILGKHLPGNMLKKQNKTLKRFMSLYKAMCQKATSLRTQNWMSIKDDGRSLYA